MSMPTRDCFLLSCCGICGRHFRFPWVIHLRSSNYHSSRSAMRIGLVLSHQATTLMCHCRHEIPCYVAATHAQVAPDRVVAG